MVNGEYGCCPLPQADSNQFKMLSLQDNSSSISLTNVMCPGGVYQCPDYNTCCPKGGYMYGCCLYTNGVCRADMINCCPEGTYCTSTGCV